MNKSVGAVSLGCDKNRVDTERMLSYFKAYGFEVTPDASQADVIVVNTCGFIGDAKEESVNTILEYVDAK
ncbi:MAG: 30S ribosomal protein S12 methylthiotransferase RimO, partial [Clostridia bacterium]|nr:30S ribosomal protein S12 methylthiotransferase RimO [Clostridia bacterium]